MSDQSDNEALRQIVDGYKAAKEAKAKHEGRLRALGDSLEKFVAAFKDPGNYRFVVTPDSDITVGKPDAMGSRAIARMTPSDFDWKALCEVLNGYVAATQDKRAGASRLQDIGLSVTD